MGYIMDLRKIVSHRTLLQVGASVIVEDEQGRVLLQNGRITIAGAIPVVQRSWMNEWRMQPPGSCWRRLA